MLSTGRETVDRARVHYHRAFRKTMHFLLGALKALVQSTNALTESRVGHLVIAIDAYEEEGDAHLVTLGTTATKTRRLMTAP
jgi:hypothetical protein